MSTTSKNGILSQSSHFYSRTDNNVRFKWTLCITQQATVSFDNPVVRHQPVPLQVPREYFLTVMKKKITEIATKNDCDL